MYRKLLAYFLEWWAARVQLGEAKHLDVGELAILSDFVQWLDDYHSGKE
jgi:hypothetical protein